MNLRTLTLDELARRWLSTGEADVANEIAKRVLEGEYIDADTHTPVNDLLIENRSSPTARPARDVAQGRVLVHLCHRER